MYLYDPDGKCYLDFGSGIGVCGLGYHDPNYTRMLQDQLEKLLHTSISFTIFLPLKLQRDLIRTLIWNWSFPAISVLRQLSVPLRLPRCIIFYGTKSKRRNHCHEEVFSCKSMGALSITGKAAYQEPFGLCFLISNLPILMILKVSNG